MAAAISVEGVSKMYRLYHERNQSLKGAVMRRARVKYESFAALDDVSLEIPAGETFGLIGENGCGKSTLLKCIARILRPGCRHDPHRGQDLRAAGARRRLPPRALRAATTCTSTARSSGCRRSSSTRASTTSSASPGLEHFIDTPVKNYSSGMYVRLGFSVAINVDPDILLVDEVLAVGDEEFQRRCSEKFAELKHSGKTVVIVSHALGSVRNLCDEVALLEHGKLIAIGPAGEVIDGYLAEVHVDRVADGEYGSRWGSGEGKIETGRAARPRTARRPTTSTPATR